MVYSELLTMFANTYDRMGDTRTARELSDRAYAHAVQAFGRDDARTARPLALRGRIYLRLQESREAQADLERALTGASEILRSARNVHPAPR